MTRLRSLAAPMLLALGLMGASAMATDLLPQGTLRAVFIGSNPVQAVTDANTKEVTGPAADITRALATKLNVPATIAGASGVPGVLAAVKSGAADIGFLAFDEVRAAEVDFSQTYALAQNTFLVRKDSRIRSVADVDKPGIRIGVGARDAGDLFLTRTLKHGELIRFEAGNLTSGLEALAYGRIDAFAANRQRLTVAARDATFRLLPDNFYGVEQSVIVQKGNTRLLEAVNRFLSEARESEFIAASLRRSGVAGLDVAPAVPGLVYNVPRSK